jgi:AcrR family transcriptional regulator
MAENGNAGIPKRQLIMEAGLKIFSQKGFHKTKIEEIAQEAGIGKGTVYEYFAGKEQLFQEILEDGLNLFDTLVQEEVQLYERTNEKLQALVRNSIVLWQRYRPLARSMLSEITLFDEAFRTSLLERHERWLSYIQMVIDEGIKNGEIREINSKLFARLFYGGIGTIVNPYDDTMLAEETIAELARQTVDYYLRGIVNTCQ